MRKCYSDLNPSKEFLDNFDTFKNMVTEVPIKEIPKGNDLNLIERRIDEVFQMVKKIDYERGMQMRELRANQFQISRIDLLLKRSIVLTEQAERYWNVMPRNSDINMYSSKYAEAYSIITEAHKLEL
ncbi:MAG: hypothetical protein WBX81_06900 [Nitrososphaeraceae archaeon]